MLPAPSLWIEKEETFSSFIPYSNEWLSFWRTLSRRCIEGYWVAGTWIPPLMYSYCNLWHIKIINRITRPYPRDIDFEKAWFDCELMGFYGFDGDDEFSAHILLSVEDSFISVKTHPNLFKKDGTRKTYCNPRRYMRNTTVNLGKALYDDTMIKNNLDLEARGAGKSYWDSHNAWHCTHFDSATDYDLWFAAKQSSSPFSAQVLVSAITTDYSRNFLSMYQIGMELLPGATLMQSRAGSRMIPPPFKRGYKGTFDKEIEFVERINIGKMWKETGSHSKLTHRTYHTKATAANGTRPRKVFIDEVGFMVNLTDVLSALEACVAPSGIRQGSVRMLGTGGLNDTAGIREVTKVFYNPESYNCLVFEDIHEGRGKICQFVPQPYTYMKYYDPETMTIDKEKATQEVEAQWQKNKARGISQRELDMERTNAPLIPSHALMSVAGNTFPVEDLKAHLDYLQTEAGQSLLGTDGRFDYDLGGSVVFTPGGQALDYPVAGGTNTTGAATIWEQPYRDEKGVIPQGLYIAGNDPYDHDQSGTGSLGSTFIMRRFFPGAGINDVIVAEYTARPSRADEHHEQVLRMMEYYNAVCLHENERNSIVDHFEHKYKLHRLANTPNVLKATERTKVNRGKGQHMNIGVKIELEEYARQWLGDITDGLPNYKRIRSKPLLKELISYTREGNFDRVIAFLMMVCYNIALRKTPVEQKKIIETKPFFKKRLYVT